MTAIGARYGVFEVVGPTDRDPRTKQARVLVRCECGLERSVYVHNLVQNASRKCRCDTVRPWEPDEDARLLTLNSVDEITDAFAATLKRSKEAARRRARKLGVGASKFVPKSWTPAEDEMLLRLRGDRMSWAKIGLAIDGRGEGACQNRHALLASKMASSAASDADAVFVGSTAKQPGHPVSWSAITLRGTPFDARELRP